MKIFDKQISTDVASNDGEKIKNKGNKESSKSTGRRNKIKPERENVSDSEIRQKLAASVDITNKAKQKIAKPNTQKLGDGFMANSEVLDQKKAELQKINKDVAPKISDKTEVEAKEEVEKVKSDVGSNNPNDPGTKEKLKDVLGKGAFSFNGRERDILEKILMQD